MSSLVFDFSNNYIDENYNDPHQYTYAHGQSP
jgi:hypothetical protein